MNFFNQRPPIVIGDSDSDDRSKKENAKKEEKKPQIGFNKVKVGLPAKKKGLKF